MRSVFLVVVAVNVPSLPFSAPPGMDETEAHRVRRYHQVAFGVLSVALFFAVLQAIPPISDAVHAQRVGGAAGFLFFALMTAAVAYLRWRYGRSDGPAQKHEDTGGDAPVADGELPVALDPTSPEPPLVQAVEDMQERGIETATGMVVTASPARTQAVLAALAACLFFAAFAEVIAAGQPLGPVKQLVDHLTEFFRGFARRKAGS